MSSLTGNKIKNTNSTEQLITLDTFFDYFIANSAKNKLQSEGIYSFLEEESSFTINSFGSIELKVFQKDLKNAFRILSH